MGLPRFARNDIPNYEGEKGTGCLFIVIDTKKKGTVPFFRNVKC